MSAEIQIMPQRHTPLYLLLSSLCRWVGIFLPRLLLNLYLLDPLTRSVALPLNPHRAPAPTWKIWTENCSQRWLDGHKYFLCHFSSAFFPCPVPSSPPVVCTIQFIYLCFYRSDRVEMTLAWLQN